MCTQISIVADVLKVASVESGSQQYFDHFVKQKDSRGIHDTLVLFHYYYNVIKAICLCSTQPKSPSRWIRRGKNGIPSFINRLLDTMDLDLEKSDHKRFALTFFAMYEIYKTNKVCEDLESLTAPQSCVWTKDTTKLFVKFVKNEKFVQRIVKKSKPPERVRDFISLKGGPYGLSTPSWIEDLLAINSYEQLASVIKLERQFGSTNPMTHLIKVCWSLPVIRFEKLKIFRTFAFPDKGPKVRTVTCGNYFVQRVLLPVHNWLMQVLKEIPEDGTHRQSNAAKLVKSWTSKGLQPYCFDMTSATDRMPVNLQFMVFYLLKQPWSEEWFNIMNNAKSYCDGINKVIELSVGQPMGIYSSWPSFTLTHHYIIRFSFYLNNIKPKGRYAIIGDDVSILDKEVALTYKDLIQGIGIAISDTKSLTPETTTTLKPVGELAKRLFYKGEELSPIRPNLLMAIRREQQGPGLLKSLVLETIERWGVSGIGFLISDNTTPTNAPVLKLLPKKKRNQGRRIIESPYGGRRLHLFYRMEQTGIPEGNIPQRLLLKRYSSVWDQYNKVQIRFAFDAYKDKQIGSMIQDVVNVKEFLNQLASIEVNRDDIFTLLSKGQTFDQVLEVLQMNLNINPFYSCILRAEEQLNELLSNPVMLASRSPERVYSDLTSLEFDIAQLVSWCNGSIRRDGSDVKKRKNRQLMRLVQWCHGFLSSIPKKRGVSFFPLPKPVVKQGPSIHDSLLSYNRRTSRPNLLGSGDIK
jgi:hypothetical protein